MVPGRNRSCCHIERKKLSLHSVILSKRYREAWVVLILLPITGGIMKGSIKSIVDGSGLFLGYELEFQPRYVVSCTDRRILFSYAIPLNPNCNLDHRSLKFVMILRRREISSPHLVNSLNACRWNRMECISPFRIHRRVNVHDFLVYHLPQRIPGRQVPSYACRRPAGCISVSRPQSHSRSVDV